jgi:hypothetical protein
MVIHNLFFYYPQKLPSKLHTYKVRKGVDPLMEELISQVANVGFPIVVSAYLLIRIENKMDNLTSSITQLSNIISIKLGENNGKVQ